MTLTTQLALDFGYRPAFGRDEFLVAPANQEAVEWIDRWPDWPTAALVLEGPRGAGKTHLASVWRSRTGAEMVAGATLDLAAVPGLAAHCRVIVEAADEAPEQPLLHLHNAIKEAGGSLLLTARTPPARWSIGLPDLRSRLNALPVASIQSPDDGLMRAILIKLFADRRAYVTADTIEFMANRLERSFEAAQQAVGAIDAASLADGRRITVALARDVLEALKRDPESPLRPSGGRGLGEVGFAEKTIVAPPHPDPLHAPARRGKKAASDPG